MSFLLLEIVLNQLPNYVQKERERAEFQRECTELRLESKALHNTIQELQGKWIKRRRLD